MVKWNVFKFPLTTWGARKRERSLSHVSKTDKTERFRDIAWERPRKAQCLYEHPL